MKGTANYDALVLERLLKGERFVNSHGAKVKISQGADIQPGFLDPWLLERLQSSADQRQSQGGPDLQSIINSGMGIEKLLVLLRNLGLSARGDANTIDLCQGEIQVDHSEHVFWENKIKLWRYQKKEFDTSISHPCLVHFHGGGFFAGSPDGHNDMLKYIAEKTDAVVFDLDYSLSPEYKFPHAFMDCYNAVKHVYEHAAEYHVDPDKIAIGGGSAGANISAAITLKAKAEGTPPIALQVLMNPAVLFGATVREGYVWDKDEFFVADEMKPFVGEISCPETDWKMAAMAKPYRGDEPAENIYLSPMLASDFSGLPKALIFTSELDGLRIQGEYYAGLLTQAGVDVRATRYTGTMHETLGQFGYVPLCEACAIEIVNAIKAL